MSTLRKFSVLLSAVLLLLSFSVAFAADDDDDDDDDAVISQGCAAVDGAVGIANPEYSFVSYPFFEGDTLIVAITGTGTEFVLEESGSVVVGPVLAGNSLKYIIPVDGDYVFSINVTGSGVDTEVSVSCTPADDDDDDDGGGIVIPRDGNVTVCHRPPGNPAAAHTITVGAPAAHAHIGHGDTLGACPASVETRQDDPDHGTSIFIIPTTGEISLWGNCQGDSCSPVFTINVIEITIINQVIINTGSPTFVVVDEAEEVPQQILDDDPTDATHAVIYYLHPDPSNPNVGVFQINVYVNNTLINDSVLVFIDVNGNIVLWTDHRYWFEQADHDDDGDDDGDDD